MDIDNEADHPEQAQQGPENTLVELLTSKIVGQPGAMQYIAPYVEMYQAGLAPPDRPAGVFLLLGPTGTGKTRTVEALAEILHGSPKAVLKINCGEFQSDHEVARLIGAPPGYLGHRETKALLTQERLAGVTSSGCDLSLVLFDEIEKAAPALTVLLLGLLDTGVISLGDNSEVSFERSLIFLTSNLGAREMMREVQPGMGFQPGAVRAPDEVAGRLESIGISAVRRRFSPEFVNRIDAVITYQPLDSTALARILDHQIEELQRHVCTRLGERSFEIEVTDAARQVLLESGTSPHSGARELKRAIHRLLTQPLAALVAANRVAAGCRVVVDAAGADALTLIPSEEPSTIVLPPRQQPTVLVLDDNPSLLEWLAAVFRDASMLMIPAASAAAARELAAARHPDVALLDQMLPDGDGLQLALEFRATSPRMPAILMTGTELSVDETATCERYLIPVLRKPFLGQEAINAVRAGLTHAQSVKASGR